MRRMAGADDAGRPTKLVPPRDGQVQVQQFRLTVLAGQDAGAAFVSQGTRVVIGTHQSCDFVLSDRTVSRFHCEITLTGGRPLLRDLDSRNGSLTEGLQVVECYLRSGVTLALGTTKIRFELVDANVSVPVSGDEKFGTLVGRSPVMRAVFAKLERAAANESTVLLSGETGTGKEAAAEAIHTMSARRDGPLVVIDCTALPPNLMESELFGHERGAFTGAVGARTGAFEEANGGTIFIDEIGELDSELQPKLLRALENREIKRVGESRYKQVDVRVIAATNRDLRSEVNAHRFRPDLYYRLAVLEIRMPSLRERPEDLPLLVDHLLLEMETTDRPEAAALRTDDFLSGLAGHSWPGNVRELRNHLERCLALRVQGLPSEAPSANLAVGSSGESLPDCSLPLKMAREQWNRALERQYLTELLRKSGGNVSAAARAAGVGRIYLYRRLWMHNLK